MWLATEYGFFSVVMAREDSKDPFSPPSQNKMMIRARSKAHLVNLKLRFEGLGTIVVTDDADYRYRIFTSRQKALEVFTEAFQDIDYTNFKSQVLRSHPEDYQYEDFLHGTWELGLRMTKTTFPAAHLERGSRGKVSRGVVFYEKLKRRRKNKRKGR